ncbi:Histidine kinase-, DNA gyrase B-, and HSP90-like ATPase [Ruminococcaceae bacterium P7]|nr:Histidine kinase-, DNA gyrase B-, and HSP90-like ATPase [Ruminococcaceae bacterium P7]
MKDKTSKLWTAGIIGAVFLLFIGLVVICANLFLKKEFIDTPSMFLQGEYSVDDGEWKAINPDKPIDESFHKIVFRGTMTKKHLLYYEELSASTKNVWFTLRSEDGTEYLKHSYLPADESYTEDLIQTAEKTIPFALRMPDTPGYQTQVMFTSLAIDEGITENTEFTLEVIDPYSRPLRFSDCFEVTLSHGNGAYLRFSFEALPMILLSLLISFFGIFLFPIAGFILGKLNYRYLAFGAVCFFWGLFMIGNRVSVYLNLWITDPTVCMAVDILMVRIFMISVLCYLKSNLINKVTRLIANITITVYTLVVIATVILHFAAVTDLFSSYNAVNICTMIGIVIMTLLLFIESGQNSQAIFMLIAWTPLTLSIILDVFNYFLQFTDIHFYYFGLSLTMLYQITRMVLDLRKQYLEAIRYQQMQKELYEAKVAVMTSQIRPHFMYNALTSIAMMCELDPKTAKQATITFAKYLRGNMDSLKQTAPVPFTQELEHLKKYLYIEKLRFDDLLNIEYDIQATDFVLPLLSIQPLVENAVKHGVGMKEDGGTVKISTRETETAYEVVIEDDGVGFDVNEQKDDGRSHVGMENTKKRLRDMCGGEVKITSVIGKGTTAIVVLPKEGQPDENTMS